MVVAPNHVSYLHKVIIDHDGVIVGRVTVGADQNKVTNHVTRKAYLPVYEILPNELAFPDLQPDRCRLPFCDSAGCFFSR